MTKMKAVYQGHLNCQIIHEQSGAKIETTAPKDNGGNGDKFSPTDLFAASLASCMLTVMGLAAKKHQINMDGATAEIEKEMVVAPVRRIGKLSVSLHLPAGIPVDKRELLEAAAHHCPVHHSLHPEIEVSVQFIYEN
ncbi:MAG: OsmC-like protein [Gammaproteobacteria bacterium]|jgi:putative redox protein|nr:OsmC-like protein [Gammaproteobacteria bacterium]